MKTKYFAVLIATILMVFGLIILLVLFISKANAQTPPQEFVQLQPFRVLEAKETYFVKVGTVGTNELQTCNAAVKVWNLGFYSNLNTYCRIQSDGYAAVYFENKGETRFAVYDRIRVVVK